MGKSLLKFFPLEPHRGFKPGEVNAIKQWLFNENLDSIVPESFELLESNGVQFIDCGKGLVRINCPFCGKIVPLQEWDSLMKKDYDGINGYRLQEIYSCSCRYSFHLHALMYKRKCGFSNSWVSIETKSHVWMGWLREYPWIDFIEATL